MTAITAKNAGTIHQISPTVLSSDLFTPLREPRVTLPTIGVQVRDTPAQGVQPWGGCLTTYGGLGGLPFLGTYRVRDLHQGRSHRHFGSGLSYHPTTTQPYRLTTLKLSDCRTNDQRLTTPLKADGVSSNWQREAWPGHHPYFSHRSIFEVFPTGVSSDDPKEPSHGAVSQTTRIALKRVQENLYQQTLYRDSFDKETVNSAATDASKEPVNAIFLSNNRFSLSDKLPNTVRNNGADLDETVNDVDDKWRVESQENEENEGDESDEEPDGEEERILNGGSKELGDTSRCDDEVEQYKSEIKESVRVLLDKLSRQRKERERLGYPPLPKAPVEQQRTTPPVPPPPPPLNHLPPCLTSFPRPHPSNVISDTAENVLNKKILFKQNHPAQKLTFAAGSPVAGVGPCWPPSTSYVIDNIGGSQLLERSELSEFPEAYLSTLQPRSSTVGKSTCSRDSSKPFDLKTPSSHMKPEMYSDYGYFPKVPLKEGHTLISPTFFDKFHTAIPVYQRPNSSVEGATILRRPNGDILYLPPVPLSDCLTPSGSKIPHKLGLRFKTEAHRRFHAMHREEVPDLRSTKNWGKKYFFFDYHSSALRG